MSKTVTMSCIGKLRQGMAELSIGQKRKRQESCINNKGPTEDWGMAADYWASLFENNEEKIFVGATFARKWANYQPIRKIFDSFGIKMVSESKTIEVPENMDREKLIEELRKVKN